MRLRLPNPYDSRVLRPARSEKTSKALPSALD
jgi:hypothetical protein